MKTLTFCTLIAASLIASHVHAQGNRFEGASIGYNVNFHSTTNEVTSGTDQLKGLGWTSLGGSLQGAYGWPVGREGLFSIGATYSINDVPMGDIDSPTGSTSYTEKDVLSVYMEPGFKLSSTTLAYARISYEGATLRAQSTGSLSQKLDGAGYGFGMRSMLDSRWYVQAEVKQVVYTRGSFNSSASQFKPSATSGTIGFGYQF